MNVRGRFFGINEISLKRYPVKRNVNFVVAPFTYIIFTTFTARTRRDRRYTGRYVTVQYNILT